MKHFDQYIHPFTDDSGETRYAVAEWDEFHGQYVAPLDARTRKLTGCSTEFAKTPKALGGYKTKRQALRRARYLYGDANGELPPAKAGGFLVR